MIRLLHQKINFYPKKAKITDKKLTTFKISFIYLT